MDNIWQKLIEKYWLTYPSIALVLIAIGYTLLEKIPEEIIESKTKLYIYLLIALFVLAVVIIICIKNNKLPHSKNGKISALFVVDAENEQLYDDVKNKLINTFSECNSCDGCELFDAVYIHSSRIQKKYRIQNKEDMVELLQKTGCVSFIKIKYSVDTLTHVENFEMDVQYGVKHPTLAKPAQEMLQYDMDFLTRPVGKRKFHRNEAIDELRFSGQTLSIICRYVVGLIQLLTEHNEMAYSIFKELYTAICHINSDEINRILPLIRNRYYFACIQLFQDIITSLGYDKEDTKLIAGEHILDEANLLIPDTYHYYIDKAFICMALRLDSETARKCITKCRAIEPNAKDWLYSDAFLDAFSGKSSLTIYKKYKKAFRSDYNIELIANYIEYILNKDPTRIKLHLAAYFVYSQMGNEEVAFEHYCTYLKENPDDRIIDVIKKTK